jgi:hypothetical protein
LKDKNDGTVQNDYLIPETNPLNDMSSSKTHSKNTTKKPVSKRPAQVKKSYSGKTGFSTAWIFLSISVLFLIIVRLRLLGIPFERDEAGFTYIGKMMFEGKNLYTDLPDNKLPGLYFLYGLFSNTLGYSPAGVHAGLLIFNLLTLILLFLFTKKIFDTLTAAMSAAIFSVMIVSIDVNGFAAHATQLLLLPGMLGLWCLQQGIETRKRYYYLLSGLCLGVTITIKQQGLFFIAAGGLYLLTTEIMSKNKTTDALKNIFLFSAASIIPFAFIIIYMQLSGRGESFWYWTWHANFASVGNAVPDKQQLFFQQFGKVVHQQWLFWVLALTGILIAWMSGLTLNKKILLTSLAVFSIVMVIPGYYIYSHYFVLAIPAIAIASALAANYFKAGWKHYVPIIILTIAFLQAFAGQFNYFFRDSHSAILVSVYGNNPFPESKVLGDFIADKSKKGDKLLVLGSEPELLVYSKLESPLRHIYTYSMMNNDTNSRRFQNELLVALDTRPRFVAFTNINASWFYKDTPSNREFWTKMTKGLAAGGYYRRIATADLFSDGTDYHYGDEAATLKFNRSKENIEIYERIK